MRINGSEAGSRMGSEGRKRRAGGGKTAAPKGSAVASRAPVRRRGPTGRARTVPRQETQPPIAIRPARPGDLAAVTAIDARVTGLAKAAYWRGILRRYGEGAREGRHLLVAEAGGEVVGFIIGEVRDWEFGSPPCGWVFAIDVHPDARLSGVGTKLLAAMVRGFRRAGVRTIRTILARENSLILSFFRSQGMMAGPFIPLEMELD
jgi:L-amino acid N-acyltransferase YncA